MEAKEIVFEILHLCRTTQAMYQSRAHKRAKQQHPEYMLGFGMQHPRAVIQARPSRWLAGVIQSRKSLVAPPNLQSSSHLLGSIHA